MNPRRGCERRAAALLGLGGVPEEGARDLFRLSLTCKSEMNEEGK
jgi:hypothetical protein